MIASQIWAGGMMAMNLSVFVGVCADLGATNWILFHFIHAQRGFCLISLIPLLRFISFSFLRPLPVYVGLDAKSRIVLVSVCLLRYFRFRRPELGLFQHVTALLWLFRFVLHRVRLVKRPPPPPLPPFALIREHGQPSLFFIASSPGRCPLPVLLPSLLPSFMFPSFLWDTQRLHSSLWLPWPIWFVLIGITHSPLGVLLAVLPLDIGKYLLAGLVRTHTPPPGERQAHGRTVSQRNTEICHPLANNASSEL